MCNLYKVLLAMLLMISGTTYCFADAPMGMWYDSTHNTISLGWTDSSDETAYKIYLVGNPTPLTTLAADTVSFEVNDIHGTALTPTTLYQFKITAMIGGQEVEHSSLQITQASTTHLWSNGPFKTCINAAIGIGATITPTKDQLESLDSGDAMIMCESQSISDISPAADLINIVGLSLKDNQLDLATIAPIASLTQLSGLILAGNDISGSIPSWIANMTLLTLLDLSDNNLTGSIPAWLTDLLSISTLKLFDNQLTGIIPTDIGNWTNLHNIYLAGNNLYGNIPVQIAVISTLQQVDFSNNNLTGSIPPNITNNSNLFSLDLSNNQLSGSIPTNLDNLTGLGMIDLSHNQLTGSIPVIGITSFPNNGIDFSYNKLTGSIPSSLGQLFNLRSLHLAHNYLKGEIPDSLTSLNNINYGDISLDYNCDIDTNNTPLINYLNTKLITGYDGIINTNGNCSKGISPSIIMFLMD